MSEELFFEHIGGESYQGALFYFSCHHFRIYYSNYCKENNWHKKIQATKPTKLWKKDFAGLSAVFGTGWQKKIE